LDKFRHTGKVWRAHIFPVRNVQMYIAKLLQLLDLFLTFNRRRRRSLRCKDTTHLEWRRGRTDSQSALIIISQAWWVDVCFLVPEYVYTWQSVWRKMPHVERKSSINGRQRRRKWRPVDDKKTAALSLTVAAGKDGHETFQAETKTRRDVSTPRDGLETEKLRLKPHLWQHNSRNTEPATD